jgi:hypothetical protein
MHRTLFCFRALAMAMVVAGLVGWMGCYSSRTLPPEIRQQWQSFRQTQIYQDSTQARQAVKALY